MGALTVGVDAHNRHTWEVHIFGHRQRRVLDYMLKDTRSTGLRTLRANLRVRPQSHRTHGLAQLLRMERRRKTQTNYRETIALAGARTLHTALRSGPCQRTRPVQSRYILRNLGDRGWGAKDSAPTMQKMPHLQETDHQPGAYDPNTIAARATRYYADLFENPGENDEYIQHFIKHRSQDWQNTEAIFNQDDIRTAI